jgi:hypothetical protein
MALAATATARDSLNFMSISRGTSRRTYASL